MNFSKQHIGYLLQQHLADRATEKEQQELFNLLKTGEHAERFRELFEEMMVQEKPVRAANPEQWQQMIQDIVNLDSYPVQPAPKAAKRVFAIYRWAAAAAILVLAGLWLYYMYNGRSAGRAGSQKNAIAFNTISTAPGQQRSIVLPDGSHVWLNAASSIKFPAVFNTRERVVELNGEAWFDVQHADRLPFRIHSGRLTTTVMGTAFDIKAYPGQKAMSVSVQRGRVKVQTGDTILAILEKGQQVRVATGADVHKTNIDSLSVAAWKQGNLLYRDEMLDDIIADLQRIFNSTIIIKRTSLKSELLTVSFNKDTGLQNCLAMICRITDSRLSYTNGIYSIE